MTDQNKILIALEAQALQGSLAGGLRELDQFVFKARKAEQAVGQLQQQLQTLSGPQLLRNMKAVGQALAGSFDQPHFRLQVLQKQLKDYRSQTVNLLSELGAAQARYSAKIATSVREQQIAGFIQRNRLSDIRVDNNLESLKARAEAERRVQNAAKLTGQDIPQASVRRLDEVESKIRRINEESAKARVAERSDQTIKDRLLANEAKQLASISAIEKQQIEIKQAALRLEQARKAAGGQITADVRERISALQAEKVKLKELQLEATKARQASRPQASPQETAQRTNDNVRARFALNNGADIFKLQTQILANYQLVSLALQSIRGAFTFTTQFEQSLKELQAIVGATDGEVSQLSNTFLDLSTTTRFTGTEIARAAVILGQAGLSASQIKSTIKAVSELAVATGTDLKLAVDLATSVMGIFNIRAEEMANVTNIVSAALNQSKLDGEKLALGLQYAGNIAATTGVSFLELTTALAAMSNAGVRAGSTLGTGTRQLLQDLVNPSEKLKEKLDRLNLTVADIDVKSQGLFGALKNLRDAGFTTADALETMELRGASAFANLVKQLPGIEEMQIAIATTGDAAKANATQLESMDSAVKRLGASAGAFVARISGPLVDGLKLLANTLADGLARLSEFHDELAILVTFIGAGASIAITRWVGLLGFSLLGLNKLGASTKAFIALVTGATGVVGKLTAALTLLGRANLVFIGITAAVTLAAVAYNKFKDANQTLEQQLDAVNTRLNESKGRYTETQTATESINKEIDALNNRYSRLSTNNKELQAAIAEVNNKFRDMGFYVSQTGTSIDTLISKLRDLSTEQKRIADAELAFQQGIITQKANLERQRTQELVNGSGLYQLAGQFDRAGFRQTSQRGRGSLGSAQNIRGVEIDPAQFTGALGEQRLAVTQKARDAILQLQKTDLNDEKKVSDQLVTLTGLFTDISKLNTELSKKFGEKAGNEIGQLNQLQDFVRKVIDQINAQRGATAELNQINRAVEDSSNVDTAANNRIRLAIQEFRRRKTQIGTNLGEALRTGSDRDQARKIANEQYVALFHDFQEQYLTVLSELEPEARKVFENSHLAIETENFIAELAKTADQSNIEIHKRAQKRLEETQKTIKARITEVESRLNSRTGASDLKKVGPELEQLYSDLLNIELSLATNKRRQLDLQQQSSEVVTSDQQIRERVLTEQKKSLEHYNQFIDSFIQNVENVDDKIALLPNEIKALGTAFDGIKKTLTRSTDAAKNIVEQQNAKIAAAQLRINGNADRISNVQVQSEKDKLEGIQLRADQQKLGAYKVATADLAKLNERYNGVIQQFQDEAEASKERRAALEKTLKGDGSDSQDSIEKFQKERQKELALQAQILSLEQKRAAVREEMKKVTQEQNQLEQDLVIRQTEQTPFSIGEGFRAAFEQYQREQGLTKDLNVQLIDSFKGMFDTVGSAFKVFINDTTTGTKSVVQAFKDMGLNILKYMAEFAAEMAAKGFLKLLLNFGLKLFSGSGGVPDAPINTANIPDPTGFAGNTPSLGRVMGGYIRAAQGKYASTRDSVPSLLMPGEYVVRKGAVDAVGVDFMNRLNSLGARALDTSLPLPANQNSGGAHGDLNVWVVAPDQVPPPGPKDIIATVASDLSTGGVTKQLVKRIAGGGL